MGLETVELEMQIEEKFYIDIPPEASENILTVGSLCEYIINAKRLQGEELGFDEVFQRVKRIIEETGYAEDNPIKPDSRFIEDLGFD